MRIVDAVVIGVWRRNRMWLAAFVAIWLLALCIPPVRQLLLHDLFGSSILYGGGPLSFEPKEPTQEFNFKKLSSQDVSTRFATSVQTNYGYDTVPGPPPFQMPLPAAVMKANNAIIPGGATFPPGTPPGIATAPVVTMPKPPTGNPQANIDKLIQQYPRESWLIAHRLRQTLSWMQDNRFAGLYEWRQVRPMKIPAVIPEKKPCPPYFTTEQWKQTLELAQQGQQLEPDNAFFDVVQLYLNLAAYRDSDAMRVLASAISKPRFDDHVLHERSLVIRVHEKFRPLLLEEKFQIRTTESDGANFSRIAMMLAWQAWKMENAGQRKQGLQLRHQMALLADLTQRDNIRQAGDYLTQSLQTHAYTLHPWQRLTKADNQKLQKQFKAGSQELQLSKTNPNAIRFVLVARSLGQNDIANTTLQLTQQHAQRYAIAQADDSYNGLSERDMALLGGWQELRSIVAFQLMFLLAASLFLGLFLIGSYFAPPPRPVLVSSTAWCLAFVILCAIAFMQLTQRQQATFSSQLHSAIGLSLITCIFSPLVISALYAWIKAKQQLRLLRKNAATDSLEKRDVLSIGVSWSFVVTATVALVFWFISVYCFVKGPGNITVPVVTWNSAPVTFSSDPEGFFAVGVLLFSAIYVTWFFAWRAFTPKTLQPLLHGALREHRNALSAFALCSSALYVLTILLSLPHRNAMNAKFEIYLQGKPTQQTTLINK